MLLLVVAAVLSTVVAVVVGVGQVKLTGGGQVGQVMLPSVVGGQVMSSVEQVVLQVVMLRPLALSIKTGDTCIPFPRSTWKGRGWPKSAPFSRASVASSAVISPVSLGWAKLEMLVMWKMTKMCVPLSKAI